MIFSDSPSQKALERMMMQVKGFPPRGSGVMVLRRFEYTAEMCDCRLCLYYNRKKKCTVSQCPCIEERIVAGAAGRSEVMTETMKDIHNAAFRKRLIQFIRESEELPMNFRNEKHRLAFDEAIRKQNLSVRSVYIGKTKGNPGRVLNVAHSAPQRTSMTPTAGVSTYSVAQNAPGVNTGNVQNSVGAAAAWTNPMQEAVGVDVEFYESGTETDAESRERYVGAQGSYTDGKIRLDINAGATFVGDLANGVMKAMSHELTHFIEDYSPTMYRELHEFVISTLEQKFGADKVEDMIERKIARAEGNGHTLTREGAEAELVADSCEMLLRDSKTVQELVRQNLTLGQRIKQWLDKFVARLRELFGETTRPEAQAVMEQLEQAQEIWDRALADAVQAHDAIGNKNTATATEGGVQYSSRADVLALDDRVDWMANDSSVKDQLNKHQKEIAEAFPNGPIISIQYNGEIDADLDTAIMEQALKAGTPNETRTAAAFNRDGITFEFDLVGTRKIRGHASSNDALRAAAIISPYIARDGLRIAGQENHENTGLTTLTYAAPAIINGHSVNVGLVVQFMANGRPRAVNVETSGGEKLVISVTHEAQKKKSLDGTRGRTDNNPGTAPPRKAISSVITIPQNYADSNPSVKNNSEQHSDREYSVNGSYSGNGYDGYSMSNNARAAYEAGEMPMSKWSKSALLDGVRQIDASKAELLVGVDAETLRKQLLEARGWHHTSSHYNRTDFFGLDVDVVESLTPEKVAAWERTSRTASTQNAYRGDFEYIEWSGTRNHPKATTHKLTDVNIEEKGSFYIVTDDDGSILARKKIGSNGTYARSYAEEAKWQETRRARELSRVQNSSEAANELYNRWKQSGYEESSSGNIYERGRKPSRWDYAQGIENFFRDGEQRLTPNGKGGYLVETFKDGKWAPEKAEQFDESKPDIRYSDRDTEYLELAKDPEKNAARLQEMVDDAAERAGYTAKAFHGTEYGNIFNTFDESKRGKNHGAKVYDESEDDQRFKALSEKAFYFAIDKEYAEQYGNNVMHVFLREGEQADISYREISEMNPEEIRRLLDEWKSNGIDSFYIHDYDYGNDEIGVFYSEQIKSADPVTYDDDGNVIPLSERFNPENPDIRYSDREYRQEENAHTIQEAKDLGLLTKQNFAKMYQAVANIHNRGYNSYTKTAIGEYIVDDGNVIMFVSGSYENPVLTKVIILDDFSETLMEDAKDAIQREAEETGRYDLSARFIEEVYGDGYATLYTSGEGAGDGQAQQRGKRGYGQETSRRAGDRDEVSYSDRDYTALSDEKLLRQATGADAQNEEQRRMLREFQQKQQKIDRLEERLAETRKEIRAWREKAQHNADLARQFTESKNRDLQAVQRQSEKALEGAVREKEAIARDLQRQIAREKDILAGKLKPLEMQRLLKAEREKAAAEVKAHKDEIFRNYKNRKSATELRGRIRNLADEMKRRIVRRRVKKIPRNKTCV